MKLQTTITLEKPSFKLNHKSNIVLIGSCFVENMGKKLNGLHFDTEINPLGIVYNPISVAKTLSVLIGDKKYKEDDLFLHNQLYASFDHHGSFSSNNKHKCLEDINYRLAKSREKFNKVDALFITFGTAYVYKYKDTNEIVSNCHKLPANHFVRERLEIDNIVNHYKDLINNIISLRPQIKIVFTVSPIRHWKDGANGNQLSKSILLLSIDKLCSLYKNVSYFPSYEIVMDELRDYRFYAEDMLHISPQGIDYIWEKFSSVYFNDNTLQIIKKIEKLQKLINHRSLSEDNTELIKKQNAARDEINQLINC